MGNTACQGTDGLHFLGLAQLNFQIEFFLLDAGQLRDVHCDLKLHQSSVRPANRTVEIEMLPSGGRIRVFPHLQTGRMPFGVHQRGYRAIPASGLAVQEDAPALLPGAIATIVLLHVAVHE